MTRQFRPPTSPWLCGVLVFSLWGGSVQAQPSPIPAFPGAEGFGALTVGGRGGDVHLINNLHDYGPDEEPIEGSLRIAVEAEGPRTIIFRVAGTIELVRPLVITQPYLTIAGQTAPGEGVVLKNFGIEVAAPQVILRYLRVRPGDVSRVDGDAINILADDVIVDHCSTSWATDETVSVIGTATNVTIQWCLIAESLNDSIHPKGEHGYGSLLSTTGNVSIHHTIYAFHKSRSPRPKDMLLDFRNNLVYGHGDRAGYTERESTRMNYVANYIYPLEYSNNPGYAFVIGGTNARLYVADNVLRLGGELLRDDWAMIRPPEGVIPKEMPQVLGVANPFDAPPVTIRPAEELPDLLLDGAGAVLPRRDSVDRRIIDLIRSGTGRIIDSQWEVGGWPELADGEVPLDQDQDGMPDAWEVEHGLDPTDPEDHRYDLDGDGYTNLEEYLNGTDPRVRSVWIESPQSP